MTMVAGGSNGITFPDTTNTSAANVTVAYQPGLTDTNNILTINSAVFNGTSGLTVNGVTYSTARILTYSASYLLVAGGGGGGTNSSGGGGAGGLLTGSTTLSV